MRIRPTVVLALTAVCACAAGPALAAVAAQGSVPRGSSATTTSPQTIPQTTTTSSTSTNSTQSTTQTTTTPSKSADVCVASGRRAIARSLGVTIAVVSSPALSGKQWHAAVQL